MVQSKYVSCCVLFREQKQRAPLEVIAKHIAVRPARFALDVYISHLRLIGRRGEILLVDLATKEVVVRRKVA